MHSHPSALTHTLMHDTFLQMYDIGYSGSIPIGFAFKYYCGSYTDVIVDANGRIFMSSWMSRGAWVV